MSINDSKVKEAIAYSKVLILEAEILEQCKGSKEHPYGNFEMGINNAISKYLRARAKSVIDESA